MKLTKQSSLGAVIGTVGLVALLTNPNCKPEYEIRDLFHSPYSYADPRQPTVAERFSGTWESNTGYNHSGKVYVLGGTAFAAALIGLGYNALTGRVRKKEDEE
ncbi:MAG: hypothetical protein Q8R37_03855 [Nanoarchaeota archaeon]|nr:hypothetical protein [Nanoarchaeota archaeon]